MANRARPARDGIYPEGSIRFTYDGEPMDGYSELAHGRATVSSNVTLRGANIRRRKIWIKVTRGTLEIGGVGTALGAAYRINLGETLPIDYAADAAIFAASSGADVEFLEELVRP